MNWFSSTFHRLSSPRYFYRGTRGWVIWLLVIGGLGLVVGTVAGLFFAPPDRLQGDSFRIIYAHVPSAHLSQLVYIACSMAGFVYVVWRLKMADVFIKAAAPVGAILTALALFTGIVWGIPTWGTGWVWDARTTSLLVLLFLFVGLIALRQVTPNTQRAAMMVSLLAIIGVINIPIIKYSVEWFTTLHQPASIQIGKPVSIATSMLWPLLLNLLAASTFVAGAILACMRNEVLRRESHTSWARQEVIEETQE